MCYFYLVKDNPAYLRIRNVTGHNVADALCNLQTGCVLPDILVDASINKVCESLSELKCTQWKMCCTDAWNCCQTQKKRKRPEELACPQTWDGWGCWDYAKPGSLNHNTCPKFLDINTDTAQAAKNCTENGTWYIDTDINMEKTDYSGCKPTPLELNRGSTLISIVLNSIGLLLLTPAIIVFLVFRPLRCQHRIQIHIQLFLSLLISGIFILSWDVRVRWEMVENNDDVIVTKYHNTCKALSILRRFGRISPFYWMLSEGFFLHMLLVRAFQPHKRIYGYYIFSWGLPVLSVIMYAVLRKTLDDDESKTRETRALKATFILIPLFGLQQFFQIYQPLPGDTGSQFFQIADAILSNSQVITQIKNYLKNRKYRNTGRRKSSTSQTTSRRLSASSINVNGGLPNTASFLNLVKTAAAIAEEEVYTDNDDQNESTDNNNVECVTDKSDKDHGDQNNQITINITSNSLDVIQSSDNESTDVQNGIKMKTFKTTD
ncbi:hypothetical protein FSP39_023488 [Pinctada imbricata]|uniref:Uncharacterized protein n=1 Tax=Pinctada imbricata TaxID=66713 RepID=A0AA88YMV7_PINIB|nr:hypothetical protein FSP39_023488 [Pinctada imbricata]